MTQTATIKAVSTPAVEEFDRWFATLTKEGEFSQVSPMRRYAHEETNYDTQYGFNSEMPSLREGLGAVNLFREYSPDTSGPILEIGCGSGLMSTGMVAGGMYPRIVLSDPSPVFLGITRNKLQQANLDASNVRFAILMGEDVELLPPGMFSAIVMRSTLHHIIDVAGFIHAAARALRPGGIFVCQEPIADGFSLMGAIAAFFPLVAEKAGTPLTPQQHEQLTMFLDTMQFMARRDMDKALAEDKHLFRPGEVMRVADDAGLSADFRANADVRDFAPGAERPKPGAQSFLHVFSHYLKYCMNYGDSFMPLFEGPLGLEHYLSRIQHLAANGDAPALTGIFVCRKRA